MLPLDITSFYEELKEAGAKADEAFGSGTAAKGVHYLVHNAGRTLSARCKCTLHPLSLRLYTQLTTAWGWNGC